MTNNYSSSIRNSGGGRLWPKLVYIIVPVTMKIAENSTIYRFYERYNSRMRYSLEFDYFFHYDAYDYGIRILPKYTSRVLILTKNKK